MSRTIQNNNHLIADMLTKGNANLKEKVRQKIEDSKLVNCLIELRAKSELSQAELAYKMGCSPSHVSKIEHGNDSDLSFGDILKYVHCTGCNLSIMLSRADNKEDTILF